MLAFAARGKCNIVLKWARWSVVHQFLILHTSVETKLLAVYNGRCWLIWRVAKLAMSCYRSSLPSTGLWDHDVFQYEMECCGEEELAPVNTSNQRAFRRTSCSSCCRAMRTRNTRKERGKEKDLHTPRLPSDVAGISHIVVLLNQAR